MTACKFLYLATKCRSYHLRRTPLNIEEYTYGSRMAELPDWIHNGAILGIGGTESVLKRYNAMKAAAGPLLRALAARLGWPRKTSFGKQLFWNWELDTDRYPGWDKMVSELKKEDVRVMTHKPFFANLTRKTNQTFAVICMKS